MSQGIDLDKLYKQAIEAEFQRLKNEGSPDQADFLIACEYEPRAGHLTHLTFSGNQLKFSYELEAFFTRDNEHLSVYTIIRNSYTDILSNFDREDYIDNLLPTIPDKNNLGNSIFDWHLIFQNQQINDYNDYHEKIVEKHDYLCLVLVYRCFQELRNLSATEEDIEKLTIFRQFIDSISYYEYYPQEINHLRDALDDAIYLRINEYNGNVIFTSEWITAPRYVKNNPLDRVKLLCEKPETEFFITDNV